MQGTRSHIFHAAHFPYFITSPCYVVLQAFTFLYDSAEWAYQIFSSWINSRTTLSPGRQEVAKMRRCWRDAVLALQKFYIQTAWDECRKWCVTPRRALQSRWTLTCPLGQGVKIRWHHCRPPGVREADGYVSVGLVLMSRSAMTMNVWGGKNLRRRETGSRCRPGAARGDDESLHISRRTWRGHLHNVCVRMRMRVESLFTQWWPVVERERKWWRLSLIQAGSSSSFFFLFPLLSLKVMNYYFTVWNWFHNTGDHNTDHKTRLHFWYCINVNLWRGPFLYHP